MERGILIFLFFRIFEMLVGDFVFLGDLEFDKIFIVIVVRGRVKGVGRREFSGEGVVRRWAFVLFVFELLFFFF